MGALNQLWLEQLYNFYCGIHYVWIFNKRRHSLEIVGLSNYLIEKREKLVFGGIWVILG